VLSVHGGFAAPLTLHTGRFFPPEVVGGSFLTSSDHIFLEDENVLHPLFFCVVERRSGRRLLSGSGPRGGQVFFLFFSFFSVAGLGRCRRIWRCTIILLSRLETASDLSSPWEELRTPAAAARDVSGPRLREGRPSLKSADNFSFL